MVQKLCHFMLVSLSPIGEANSCLILDSFKDFIIFVQDNTAVLGVCGDTTMQEQRGDNDRNIQDQ